MVDEHPAVSLAPPPPPASILIPCTAPWGNADVYQSDPAIYEFPDATYVPMVNGRDWGVLDRYHRVISDTVTFHEEHWGSDRSLELLRPSEVDHAPDETYIYCGRFIAHYGHFIIDFLSRLWPLSRDLKLNGRFLFHELSDIDGLLAYPFVKDCLMALGLSRDSFVKFDRPTRIRRLIVPQPAMRPQLYAHRVMGDLLHFIGSQVGANATDDQPIYLTKRHVPAVLTMLNDEHEVEEEMVAAGVRIVSPEKLGFAEQVGLFSRGRSVFSPVGSALHTGAFSSEPFQVYGLSGFDRVNTNYLLLDEVCGIDAHYYMVPGTTLSCFEQPGSFRTEYRFPNARETARELLRLGGIR